MVYEKFLTELNKSIEQISLTLQDIYIEMKRNNKLMERLIEGFSYSFASPEDRNRMAYQIWKKDQNKSKKEIYKMDIGTLISNLNNELYNKYGNSDNQFIQDQSALIDKYTVQLTNKEITPDMYQSLIEDIQRLAKLEELQQEVEKKAIYQGFMNMIQDIILDGIVAVFKSKTA